MVGDDIVSDVGGAQAAGIRGVQVSDSLSTMMGKMWQYSSGEDGEIPT